MYLVVFTHIHTNLSVEAAVVGFKWSIYTGGDDRLRRFKEVGWEVGRGVSCES